MPPGSLFVVATPIGNLEDLTFRALRTLREVDLIAAEDTRRTVRLLAHYEIRCRMVSLREHNEVRETPRLLAALAAGQQIALVTDAGTPSISDPGATLVRAARQHGIRVIPIPGPSAVATALSASGYPADQFVFMGFPPASGEKRREWFEKLVGERRTVVLFEAPHRVKRTLEDLSHVLVDRPILVARELTKTHEELVEYQNTFPVEARERGEFAIVLGPASAPGRPVLPDPMSVHSIFGRLTDNAGFTAPDAITMSAGLLGLSTRDIQKLLKKARILVNQQNKR